MALVLREKIETLEDYLIEQSTEIVEAISAANPELVFDFASIKAGTETVVIPCCLHGNKFALRIRPKGLEKELAAYRDLQGIPGIPRVHAHFPHGDKIVGILVDFVDGPTVPEFLETASWKQIIELILAVRSLVRRVHDRNCLMPDDYGGNGNIRLDKGRNPCLVDPGDYQHLPEKPTPHQIQDNMGRISLLISPYGQKFKRTRELETAHRLLMLLGKYL